MISLNRIDDKQLDKCLGEDAWLIKDHSYKAFHVVDGQQRLTTVIILLNELVEKFRSLDSSAEKAFIKTTNHSCVYLRLRYNQSE